MTARRKLAWCLPTAALLLSGLFALRYEQEQRWLARKAHEIVDRAGALTTRERIIALRDYVRLQVCYDGVSIEGRPFLRDTAMATLQGGRGYCGEATRAFINLAAQVGIRANRINLYGQYIHVVAEAEVSPNHFILVDVQDNPVPNEFLDSRDWVLDEVIQPAGTPFNDYSNINLRRIPIINSYIVRIRTRASPLTWTLENPSLIACDCWLLLSISLSFLLVIDRGLFKLYHYRVGKAPPSGGRPPTPASGSPAGSAA